MAGIKKIYLCFGENDTQKVKKYLDLISFPGIELDYYEVPAVMDMGSVDAVRIKREIGEKIVKCSVAVCLISENTHLSPWVDIQLQKNRNKGNRIIAMALKGTAEAVLPGVIKEENITFYPWDPARLRQILAEEPAQPFNRQASSF